MECGEQVLKIITYDDQFNQNEWFVLTIIIVGIIAVWKAPKLFSAKHSVLLMLFSVFMAKIFDHTIGIPPFDYYDVNDNSRYELLDIISYLMYGPIGYFIIYLYHFFNIKRRFVSLYILGWAFVAMGTEWIADWFGVFHYKNGYQFYYSFPIYLVVIALHLLLYNLTSSPSHNRR